MNRETRLAEGLFRGRNGNGLTVRQVNDEKDDGCSPAHLEDAVLLGLRTQVVREGGIESGGEEDGDNRDDEQRRVELSRLHGLTVIRSMLDFSHARQ